jgi:hypothetical protein
MFSGTKKKKKTKTGVFEAPHRRIMATAWMGIYPYPNKPNTLTRERLVTEPQATQQARRTSFQLNNLHAAKD